MQNMDNLAAWMATTDSSGEGCIVLNVPENILRERLLARNQDRADDNIATIEKRFQVQSCMPSLDVQLKCR
jgi:adenylate kinase family enzyme